MGDPRSRRLFHKLCHKFFLYLRRPWKFWNDLYRLLSIIQVNFYFWYLTVIINKAPNSNGDGSESADSSGSAPTILWVLGIIVVAVQIWRINAFKLCLCCCSFAPPKWLLYRASFAFELPGLAFNIYLCIRDARKYRYSERFWISMLGLVGMSVILVMGGTVSTWAFYYRKKPYARSYLRMIRKQSIQFEPDSNYQELSGARRDPLAMVYEAQAQVQSMVAEEDGEEEAAQNDSESSDSGSDVGEAFSLLRMPDDSHLSTPIDKFSTAVTSSGRRDLDFRWISNQITNIGESSASAATATTSMNRRDSNVSWILNRNNSQLIKEDKPPERRLTRTDSQLVATREEILLKHWLNLLVVGISILAILEIEGNTLYILVESIKVLKFGVLVIDIQVVLLLPYSAILIYLTRKECLSRRPLRILILHAATMTGFWTVSAISRVIIPLFLAIRWIIQLSQFLDEEPFDLYKIDVTHVLLEGLKFLGKTSIMFSSIVYDLLLAGAFWCLTAIFSRILGDDLFKLIRGPKKDTEADLEA
ncbi:MAG: hypothetical protein M1840_008497 [Geoglossum simile]|nr:MAG: hypothetical protein M1840_008497 [Geoglossum simile]